MIKKLIKKYIAWKDRRFLSQLERVLSNNVLESNICTSGGILAGKNAYLFVENFDIEELRKQDYMI